MFNLRKCKILTIEINKDMGATTVNNILKDMGYDVQITPFGTFYYIDNKSFKLKEWHHFNSYVYYIKLKELMQ